MCSAQPPRECFLSGEDNVKRKLSLALSSSAKADDPVAAEISVSHGRAESAGSAITGCSAFAGHDNVMGGAQ
jgi:hypothetical protein